MTGLTAPDALALAKADALRRYARTRLAKPVALSGIPGSDREYPTLTRPLDGPILTTAAAGVNKVYWPSFVNVSTVPGAPKDWALIYSSDHDGTHIETGVFVVWADDPLDTTTYDTAELLYRDDVSGNQTETPWGVVKDGVLYVYYQQNNVTGAVGQQVTNLIVYTDLSTSPTRHAAVIDVPDTTTLPEGADSYHTGYFHCIIYNGQWYGWSLFGGQQAGSGMSWSSYDGINWYADCDLTGFGSEWLVAVPGSTKDWTIRRPQVFEFRGQMWGIFLLGAATSNEATAAQEIYTAPLAADLVTLAGQPIRIHPASYQAWEQSFIDGLGAPFEHNGRLYLTYRGGDTVVAAGIFEVETA